MKVLVVDDSTLIRSQIANAVKELGISVLTASDGSEGLSLFRANDDIALVMTDLNMPKLDGVSMIKEIRDMNRQPEVPILVVTSGNSDEVVNQCKALGVLGWVVKPVDEVNLKVLIQHVLAL